MNSDEIEGFVKGTGTKVLASDQLPTRPIKNEIFIVNTDPVSEKGTHWVLIAKLGPLIVHADPLGLPPFLRPFVSFINLQMREGNTLKFNKYPFQHSESKNCGYYCCLLAWHLHQGLSFESYCQRYSSARAEDNDELMKKDWGRFLLRHNSLRREASRDGSL
jgi:hypothetical protein